jgi:hypothetical protein
MPFFSSTNSLKPSQPSVENVTNISLVRQDTKQDTKQDNSLVKNPLQSLSKNAQSILTYYSSYSIDSISGID